MPDWESAREKLNDALKYAKDAIQDKPEFDINKPPPHHVTGVPFQKNGPRKERTEILAETELPPEVQITDFDDLQFFSGRVVKLQSPEFPKGAYFRVGDRESFDDLGFGLLYPEATLENPTPPVFVLLSESDLKKIQIFSVRDSEVKGKTFAGDEGRG